MMHPDSLWTGSQLAMALQAIKGWVGLVLAVIGVKNRTTCDFLFLHAGTSKLSFSGLK